MKYIISVLAAIAAVMLLLNPQRVSEAVCGAVYGCLDVIIPSLFAFTVLSIYLQGSGAAKIILKPLVLPMSKLMRLDEELCCVVLLSNIGGYPVGARLLTGLVHDGRLSAEHASKLMCCCYGSGPAFIIGIVGLRVFGSGAVGAAVFAACFLSSVIVGVAVCRSGEPIKLRQGKNTAAVGIVQAVSGGASVMMTVCSMIVAFAAATELFDIAGITALLGKIPQVMGAGENSAVIIRTLLEISNIGGAVPGGYEVIPLSAALLTFGGVCVLMQVAAITDGAFSLRRFMVSRIPATLLSAVLSLPSLLVPQTAVECISGVAKAVQPFSLNAALSACVLIMSGMLLCMEKRRA